MNTTSEMSNGETSAPGTARCYTLPRRFFYPEVVLFSSVAVLAAGAWIPAVYSLFKIGAVLPTALRAAVSPSITAALLLVLVLFVKYQLRKVRFLLSDEFLVRTSSVQLRKLRLVGIESVALIKLPFSGGILAVHSGRQTLHIPLSLRHIRDLVTRIKEACTETAIAANVDEAVWHEAYRRGSLTAMAVKRGMRAYRPLLTASIAMLFAAAVTGMYFWDLDLIPLMAWLTVAPTVPLVSFATADLFLRFREKREYARRSNEAEASGHIDETKTIVWSGIFYLLLYLISGIIFRTLAQ